MYYNPVDDVVAWWFDQYVSVWIKMYYWPYFLAGNADNIKDIASIHLNGIKPLSKS